MKYLLSKKVLYPLTVIVAFGVLIALTTFIPRVDSMATAKKIVADCGAVAGDHGPCYEAAVPVLYPKMTVPQVFDVIRQVRVLDPSYQFCHVLAHKLGQRVVAEDPNNWLGAIPENPTDGLCSNGFIHGVIVGRFSSEVLDDATINTYTPDFAVACEPHDGWRPSDLDQAMCYHGLGHLFDFVTNARIPKALALCQAVAKSSTGDFRQVCLEGVFMQFYQPLEPEDFNLIARLPLKLTQKTVRSFCTSFPTPEAQGACLRESWPLYREEILDGTGAIQFCANQPNTTEEEHCYNSVSSIIGRLSLDRPGSAAAACEHFPPTWQATCYVSSAQAVLEEDRTDASGALAVCTAGQPVVGSSCVESLAQHAQFIFGPNKSAQHAFCAQVPDEYKQVCEF